MTREELIEAWQANQKNMRAELASLQPDLDRAKADVEALEEPRRRLADISQQFSTIRETALSEKARLQNEILAAAPQILRAAINRLNPRKTEPLVDRAINRLRGLAFQPGDLSESVQDILSELATSESQEIFATASR